MIAAHIAIATDLLHDYQYEAALARVRGVRAPPMPAPLTPQVQALPSLPPAAKLVLLRMESSIHECKVGLLCSLLPPHVAPPISPEHVHSSSTLYDVGCVLDL